LKFVVTVGTEQEQQDKDVVSSVLMMFCPLCISLMKERPTWFWVCLY